MRNFGLAFALFSFALVLTGCIAGGGGNGGGGGGNGKGIPGATLTSLSPSSVTAKDPPFTLTVNGSGFVAGGSIILNGTNPGLPYTFVSSTEVTVQIGASFIASPGNISITATIPTPRTNPSNALNLTINPFTSSACVLFGLHRFLFTGFDANGPVTVTGTFGVDSNGIVSGEEDFKNSTATRTAQPITGGLCTNSATANEGTLTLTTATGTSTYTFVLEQATDESPRGRMAESGDANGISGSGRFVLAPPDGFFSGDYIFGLVGYDTSGGKRMSVVGRFTDNDNNSTSTPGTLSSGVGDINDAGTITSSVQITGTVGVPDLYSRSTATVTLGAQALQLVIYVTSSGGGFAMDIDSGASTPILGGLISSQANAGTMDNDFLSTIIFGIWGVAPGSPPTSDTSVGIASNFNSGAGIFNLLFDQVAGGTASLNQSVTGASYNVASNGRAQLSYTAGGKTTDLILYLDGQGKGYVQETSGSSVGFGLFETQATGPFNNASINATFAAGTFLTPVSTSPNAAGEITLNSGAISGALTGNYNVDPSGTGRGTASVNQPVFGSNNLVFYIIAPHAIEVMGSDNVSNDTIGFLHF